jgi:hypothetical protein
MMSSFGLRFLACYMYSFLFFPLRCDHEFPGFSILSYPAASYHGIRCCIGFVVIVLSSPNWLAVFLFDLLFPCGSLLTLCLFLSNTPQQLGR